MLKFKEKQPRLGNRSTSIIMQDNARPHIEQMATLEELGLELLHQPPYSADLAPTDYPTFRKTNNFLTSKNFNSDNAVKLAFEELIDSRPPGIELYFKICISFRLHQPNDLTQMAKDFYSHAYNT
ncbi:hypothetical protein GQX74_010300 [Glossina fuscipes]|nr:hypothetical protein GQX74_010300 [Glossina fuscipes]